MITEDDVLLTYQDICRKFPGFRLLWKPGNGQCAPTIGTWFFISKAWGSYTPYRRYEMLRYEVIHMRQYRRCGLGSVRSSSSMALH